jgi:hypothetical protein
MPKRESKKSLPKRMWACPRCYRQFKNRNQAHSCGQFTVGQLLAGKPQGIVELYERLDRLIQGCGEVVVAPTQTRVLFKVRTVFATVAISKNWLDVLFVLGRVVKHRRIKKAQAEYPGIVHFLRIESEQDLDAELTHWLQEAYDHREQKDQGHDEEE